MPDRRPPPPDELVGALHDPVHKETGQVRPAKSARAPDVEARLSEERERQIRSWKTKVGYADELLHELDAVRRERDEALGARRVVEANWNASSRDLAAAQKQIAELKRENARAWQGAQLLQEAEKVLEQRAMDEARTLVMHEQLQEGYERGRRDGFAEGRDKAVVAAATALGLSNISTDDILRADVLGAIRSLKGKPAGPAGGEGAEAGAVASGGAPTGGEPSDFGATPEDGYRNGFREGVKRTEDEAWSWRKAAEDAQIRLEVLRGELRSLKGKPAGPAGGEGGG